MGSTSLAHNPSTYFLLNHFLHDTVDRFTMWGGPQSDANGRLPHVSLNYSSSSLGAGTAIVIPGGASYVHPNANSLAIVAWRSPIDGWVQVLGYVKDADSTPNSSGVSWAIEKGASPVASGVMPNGSQQLFSAGTGGANLTQVQVGAGDVLYLLIDPAGSQSFDTTEVDLRIRRVAGPGTPTTTPAPSVSPSVTPSPTPPAVPAGVCTTWNPARDLFLAPAHANPGPDMCGDPGVWSIGARDGRQQDLAPIYALPVFEWDQGLGIAGWRGQPRSGYFSRTASRPRFLVNQSTATINDSTLAGIDLRPGKLYVDVHTLLPGVLKWRSPVDGAVAISGSLRRVSGGVRWSIERAGAELAWSRLNTTTQDFSAGTNGASLAIVPVAVGDEISFVVEQQSCEAFSTVELNVLISVLNQTPTPTATPPATPTATACDNWDLAGDFPSSSNQKNPAPDSCGSANTWSYLAECGFSRVPTAYYRLEFPYLNAAAQEHGWQSQRLNGTGGLPQIWKYTGTTPRIVGAFTGRPGKVMVHPDIGGNAVVRWLSPISGVVTITGEVVDADTGGGDGIAWYIHDKTSTIASGSIANGGTQSFGAGAGGSNLNQVAVTPGKAIYFVVNRNGSLSNDSTELSVHIAPYVPITPSATPTRTSTPTPTSTPTRTLTPTPTPTPSLTPTGTPTPVPTPTSTATPTPTPTVTPTPTPTPFGPPPVVEITGPAEADRVTAPIAVTGNVTSASAVTWTTEYQLVGDSTWTTIDTGSATGANVTFGTLDPTMLLNGLYEVRVRAVDVSGRSTSFSTHVVVDGGLKLGDFSLSFTDFEMPVAGVPIRITRTYDSRDKRQGEFGIGWTLSSKNVRVQENGPLGLGWSYTQSFVTFCIVPTRPHIVTLTFLDGKVYRFRAEIVNPCQGFSLPPEVDVRFTPLPGTYGSLDAVGPFIVNQTGGGVELLDDTTLDPADPSLYTYEQRDGTVLEVDQTQGLRRILDTNGNALTFSTAGITHSAGAGVPFVRDAMGRITRITDPTGRSVDYAYDAYGNLATVTDREGNVTTFVYGVTHRLLLATDPLGNVGLRTEYDGQGRIVAAIDASGKRMEFEQDVNTRTEFITDRRGNVTTIIYDADGRVITRRLPDGSEHHYAYDSIDNLLSETDPDGSTRSYTYDAAGNRTSSTDELGHTTSSTFDAAGRVTSTTDALGHTSTFTYDARGNLIRSADPLGNAQTSTYDARGNVLARTDANGNTTTSTYDALGNETSITDARGFTTTQSYDANGQLTRITSAAGRVTDFVYDANGMTTLIDAAGETTGMGYDAAGRPTVITTTLGQTITDAYDAQGRRTSTTMPDGSSTQYTYDDEGNVVTTTDALGNVMHFEYDDNGRRVRTVHPDGSAERTEYDDSGQVVRTVDRRGNATLYTYDAAGRQTAVTNALGGVTRRGYDAVGRLRIMTDTLGHETRYEFDAAGRMQRTVFADGTDLEHDFDPAGRTIRTEDAAGNATAYGFDTVGNLVSVTDALGNVTTYEYDSRGNRTAMVDANGHRTRFEYEAFGRLTKTIYPLGDSEEMTYRAGGALLTSTNGNGEVLRYGYDNMGRLADLELPDGSHETHTYTIDGLVATVTDARGVTSYSYDPVTRRLTRVTEPDGRYVRYAYDVAGNRTLMAHATASGATETTISYGYDALNRMVAITDTTGTITQLYNAEGGLVRMDRPNGTRTDVTYDTLNRVQDIVHRAPGGSILDRFTYTLDPVGNRTRITQHDGSRVDYGYDATYRLTSERYFDSGGTQTDSGIYTYDAVGNIVNRTGSLGSFSSVFNANDQLVTADGATYTYDGAGNRVAVQDAGGTRHYRFDARGRMVRFEPASGAPTDYVYDADGIRQGKSGPGGTVRYLVDQESPTGYQQVIRETDGAGATVRQYTHGRSLLAQDTGGTAAYYHADALGSVRMLTDGAGGVTDRYAYEAYGEAMLQSGGTGNVYRFAGEQVDGETGLSYLRARYYDISDGLLLSRDPFAGNQVQPLSLHKYVYGYVNPVNVTDPSGQSGMFEALIYPLKVLAFLNSNPQVAGTVWVPWIPFPRPLVASQLHVRAVDFKDLTSLAGWVHRKWAVPGRPLDIAATVDMPDAETMINSVRGLVVSTGRRMSSLTIVDHGYDRDETVSWNDWSPAYNYEPGFQMGKSGIDQHSIDGWRADLAKLSGQFEGNGYLVAANCYAGKNEYVLRRLAAIVGVPVYGRTGVNHETLTFGFGEWVRCTPGGPCAKGVSKPDVLP